MALQAYGKRVVVEPAKAEATKGKIYIPDEAKKRPLKGKVVSVGPEVTDLKAGTTVYYAAFSGTEIEVGDNKVLVLNVDDVLATE
jgi:chaperonin GroES